MSLSKCSAWICRHKDSQKCADIELVQSNEDIRHFKLCGQCLADALEEIE